MATPKKLSLILVIAAIAVISGCARNLPKNQPPVVIETPIQNATTTDEINNAIKKEYTPFPNPKKVFAPGKEALYYQLNNTKSMVDVYLDVIKIISDVPIGTAGGNMPEFINTSNHDIVLLTTGEADSGWSYKNYYYIDTKNVSVVTVNSHSLNNEPSLDIIDSKKSKIRISISIRNKCTYKDNGDLKCKNSGDASLDDLTLDGKKTGILKKAMVLSCFDPGGLGGCYKENILLEYRGISNNLDKVYFSFIVGGKEKGYYSFNVKNKMIVQEDVSFKIYHNEKYGFELQYPKTWAYNEGEYVSFHPSSQKDCTLNTGRTVKESACSEDIFLFIEPNNKKLSLGEFFRDKGRWKKGEDYEDIKEFTIGNIIVYKVTLISAYDGSRLESFWAPLSDGNFLELKEFLSKENKSVFNQMISTFKLTK